MVRWRRGGRVNPAKVIEIETEVVTAMLRLLEHRLLLAGVLFPGSDVAAKAKRAAEHARELAKGIREVMGDLEMLATSGGQP